VIAELIRVRGLVQGVGLRPTVWRLARDCGLTGSVCNDGAGVLIHAQAATRAALDQFCAQLRAQCPPLARIETVERSPDRAATPASTFVISASSATAISTAIVPDAAPCAACVAEIRDPAQRRYRYAFTNCTHCGPRFSIVERIPYDRTNTSMASFPLCPACAAEYADPADRRFHAQPTACPVCGPQLWLVAADGHRLECDRQDASASASHLLAAGHIVALKGIGGFHLACAAHNAAAVATLRQRKHRPAQPLALMARDLAVIRRYCWVNAAERAALTSPAAPIVVLELRPDAPPLPPDIAPHQTTLGMMLPSSPLHHLLLTAWTQPLVMTSGNRSGEPPCTDNADAQRQLADIADALLLHDRAIVSRVDDSVLRHAAGAVRMLRRARGFAPAPLQLPPEFATAPAVLAFGGEMKSTCCLLRDGQAVLSAHLGDLSSVRVARELAQQLTRLPELWRCEPQRYAVDLHPDYHASQLGRDLGAQKSVPVIAVQHHHAHLAAVLAEHGWASAAGAVLGIVLDGLGYGADGTLWGGEFLVGNYQHYQRVAHFKPVALPGGVQAIREPWRNLVAQLESAGWDALHSRHADLPLLRELAQTQPLALVRQMLARGVNAPLSSSAGRLFDAVAAAVGAGARMSYEGQAAQMLEQLATGAMTTAGAGYPLALVTTATATVLDAAPLWETLLADMAHGVAREQIAARFHVGLSNTISALAQKMATQHDLETVALAGGVWQNRLLLEQVTRELTTAGLRVLLPRQVPANDGGVALGQACIAAVQMGSTN
jgi:hydrogenase maturation protein HypF